MKSASRRYKELRGEIDIMGFEMDLSLILYYALWTIKVIILGIPWWLWILIILAIVVKFFTSKPRRRELKR